MRGSGRTESSSGTAIVRLSKYTAVLRIPFHKEPGSFELALFERNLSFTTLPERSAAPLRACVGRRGSTLIG
jgi:hypothetical protein